MENLVIVFGVLTVMFAALWLNERNYAKKLEDINAELFASHCIRWRESIERHVKIDE